MTSIVLLGFGNVSFNLIKTLANSSKINVLQVYNRSEIYLGKALGHIAFTTDLLKIKDLDASEIVMLSSLAVPVLFFGFYPEPFINTIDTTQLNDNPLMDAPIIGTIDVDFNTDMHCIQEE